MKLDTYEIDFDEDLLAFEFISEGPKGRINKIVQYTKIGATNLYNLGFGDKDTVTGEVNDKVITDNGDHKKVLSTIAATIHIFMKIHPNAWVYVVGGNKARMRLYRMAITNNIGLILSDFELFGLKEKEWNTFKKDNDYEAFLLRRNNLNS